MAKVADVKTRSAEYWEERANQVESLANKRANLTSKQLEKLFKDTFDQINGDIQMFYTKYGAYTEAPTFTTLADGTQVISGTAKKLAVSPIEANKALKNATRLENLRDQLYEKLNELAKVQNEQMIMSLSETAAETYNLNSFNIYKGVGVQSNFNLLTKNTISALIKNEVNGESFSERVWDNRDKLKKTVNQTLKNGITQGLSNNEMAKRLQANMDSGAYVARRLIQTETTNTLNQATLESYQNSGIVKQYQYLATLDSKTSEICADLDGQTFNLEDAVTGLNLPPMHPMCRSTTIPYFDDSPEGLTRIAKTIGGDYEYIDADVTYKEWAKKNL
jgi:SPP1 gp7 family putative phage head morphogenesis protein